MGLTPLRIIYCTVCMYVSMLWFICINCVLFAPTLSEHLEYQVTMGWWNSVHCSATIPWQSNKNGRKFLEKAWHWRRWGHCGTETLLQNVGRRRLEEIYIVHCINAVAWEWEDLGLSIVRTLMVWRPEQLVHCETVSELEATTKDTCLSSGWDPELESARDMQYNRA